MHSQSCSPIPSQEPSLAIKNLQNYQRGPWNYVEADNSHQRSYLKRDQKCYLQVMISSYSVVACTDWFCHALFLHAAFQAEADSGWANPWAGGGQRQADSGKHQGEHHAQKDPGFM